MADDTDLPAAYRGAHRFAFGDTPALADELLARVLAGVKTATCGARRQFGPGREPLPEVGRRDVVLDGAGRPAAVIETTEVVLRRYCEVPAGFTLAEGEGDFADWDRGHRIYFARTGGFDPEMEVVCERFRLVEALARPGVETPILEGWLPGLAGALIALHSRYYAPRLGFGSDLEAQLASWLAEFLPRFDRERDLILSAWEGERLLGSLTIDASGDWGARHGDANEARLRWFIVAPEAQGRGLGKRLMARGMAFVDAAGAACGLTTVEGLDTARALYERHGFVLEAQDPGGTYGTEVHEQRFRRPARGGSTSG